MMFNVPFRRQFFAKSFCLRQNLDIDALRNDITDNQTPVCCMHILKGNSRYASHFISLQLTVLSRERSLYFVSYFHC